MDTATQTALKDMHSPDRELQNRAFFDLLAATEKPVDWAYAAWDGLLADLEDADNHVRAIAAQVLCNLARSDPQDRMAQDFDAQVKDESLRAQAQAWIETEEDPKYRKKYASMWRK